MTNKFDSGRIRTRITAGIMPIESVIRTALQRFLHLKTHLSQAIDGYERIVFASKSNGIKAKREE